MRPAAGVPDPARAFAISLKSLFREKRTIYRGVAGQFGIVVAEQPDHIGKL
jgi:hypothetical protein